MKLSATINFFDGEELLMQAAANIRPVVSHLSIVWQSVSNFGNPITDRARQVLDSLRRQRLVDDIQHYDPDLTQPAAVNEIAKRRAGVALAEKAGATHILLMDADEFYVPSEFRQACAFIHRNRIDFSAVSHFVYAREPIFRSRDPVPTICAFVTRLGPGFQLNLDPGNYPVAPVDPTRAPFVSGGCFHRFPTSQIAMHHMTALRHDFRSKLANTTQNDNPARIAVMRAEYDCIKNWDPDQGMDPAGFPMVRVPDMFGLCGWRERPLP